ncbi:MAG: DUF2442 domain-containing protein [Legionellales bacterium]|nr:DUF2442 domain-containing protein [Legionellales bacterium]
MRTVPSTQQDIAPAIVCTAPWRLTHVAALDNYRLEVEFIDGVKGFVDMKALIMREKAGVFAALRDIDTFNQVYLEYGVATWPNEIDLAPDAMHRVIKQQGIWVLT